MKVDVKNEAILKMCALRSPIPSVARGTSGEPPISSPHTFAEQGLGSDYGSTVNYFWSE